MRDGADGEEPGGRPLITGRPMLKEPDDDERGAVVSLAADLMVSRDLAAAPGDDWRQGGRSCVVINRSGRTALADTGILAVWCSNRVGNNRARRVIETCGFQFRETGMVRSPVTNCAVPVERFVLERRNRTSLKSWGAGRQEASDVPRDNAA
jgi:hypothetical protein